MYILMPDDVGYLKYKKQIHELKVGKAMYEWYESQTALLNTVRQVVAYAFFRLFDLLKMDPCLGAVAKPMGKGPRYVDLLGIMPKANKSRQPDATIGTAIRNTLKNEKFLLVWDRYSVGNDLAGLGKILTEYREWSVSDCSELVRVWGGIVEAVGESVLDKKHPWTGAAEVKAIAQRLDDIRKRAKGQSQAFKGKLKPERLQTLRGSHQKWKGPGEGVRERVKYVGQERKVPEWMKRYVLAGDAYPGLIRGCSILKPVNMSLVKHLDSVYGLWEGADISGTTTDFIGCFEAAWMMAFEGVLAADNPPDVLNYALEVATWCFPYFALLAPAAMVYGYHHTMYEIAVALSLAYGVDKGDKKPAVFDYYVGWYDSIVPNISHVGSQKGGHAPLKRLFHPKRASSWTVGKKEYSAKLARGKAEEQRLRSTLTAAIQGVEKAQNADNPRLIALVDRAGVVYGGYLLKPQKANTHKELFHAVPHHEIALKKGADELSRKLLSKLNKNYMTELAGKTKSGESFYERYY